MMMSSLLKLPSDVLPVRSKSMGMTGIADTGILTVSIAIEQPYYSILCVVQPDRPPGLP